MNHGQATVYVVDDDPAVVKALSRLLHFAGHRVLAFTSPTEFLAGLADGSSGCVILDVAMPGLDGLELQEAMAERGLLMPIIFLTGHGDIPMSVRAMKHGAVDFLTKPAQKSTLLPAVELALRQLDALRQEATDRRAILARYDGLTPREREVMARVVAGKANKQIAAELGTGVQNIKVHRGRVMHKMRAESLAELVRLAEHVGVPAT